MGDMKSIQALQELVFPVRCLGCAVLGLSICSTCRRSWHPHTYRRLSRSSPYFPIYSSVQYSPIASKVLLAAKERSLAQADDLILAALERALQLCVKDMGAGVLIPIPSRPAINRLRGRQFISHLSEKLSTTAHLPTLNNLSHARKVRDQSSLDLNARIRNLDGALVSAGYFSGKAILVDDLVTTGATLQEAARALREQGIEVAASVTACVAEPLR